MHFPDQRPDQSEERILPLINVVFLLLIFFMVAGSLTATEPFEVTPPNSISKGEHEPDSLTIIMGSGQRFALNEAIVDKESLLSEIERQLSVQPETVVTLKADNTLAANELVLFTQALNQRGLTKLRLLTTEVAP
ncbi:MAG: biopolymer transporter ExbD [Pseudomonadota bacterium]